MNKLGLRTCFWNFYSGIEGTPAPFSVVFSDVDEGDGQTLK